MTNVEITYRYGNDAAPARSRPEDARAARLRLDQGNRTFAGLFAPRASTDGEARCVIPVRGEDVGLAGDASGAPAQRPFAAILGCADARVPVELVFNEGPNDVFVVRVAGNTLGDDVRGSLGYALDHLGDDLKLVVVLGHSRCGAVTAAVDVFLDPAGYLGLARQHAIRGLVDRLQVVVHAAARRMVALLGDGVSRQPGYRDALIEVATVANAALAARTIERDLAARPGGVEAVYGVYLLEERTVWAPRAGDTATAGLARPPDGPEGFVALGDAIVASPRIRALLGARA